MTIQVPSDQEIWQDALEILSERMSPAKAVRLVSFLRLGSGDYTGWRETMVPGESVTNLARQIREHQDRVREK
jgi:hypothetical protein